MFSLAALGTAHRFSRGSPPDFTPKKGRFYYKTRLYSQISALLAKCVPRAARETGFGVPRKIAFFPRSILCY